MGVSDKADCGIKIFLRRQDVAVTDFRQIRERAQLLARNGKRGELRPVLRMRRGRAEGVLKRLRARQYDRAYSRLQRCDGRIFAAGLSAGDGLHEPGKIDRCFAHDPNIFNRHCAIGMLQIVRLSEIFGPVMLAGEQAEPGRCRMAHKGERKADGDLLAVSHRRRS